MRHLWFVENLPEERITIDPTGFPASELYDLATAGGEQPTIGERVSDLLALIAASSNRIRQRGDGRSS
ncbi:hypothetical protein [Micromonospora endolithica]|uniref:Uncharacterized protein n=1 Tax=Micromonospora endolithica TaxID=230091 RepID=A0A3A9YR09_9ACTN|nr:hypothetical protein [Micromonospora endolithica]RKN37676.1 hypothetical protein D7223_32215 [Micromonospora endolithica]TWJ25169.1 hypothetical protein JD76_05332 [Micromonospora endolithica]